MRSFGQFQGCTFRRVLFRESHCLGACCVACVFRVEKLAVVWLVLLCAFGGFFGMWRLFGEVFLDLVDYRVWCEGKYSSFDVVSYLVCQGAAYSVYDYPECSSFLGGMAVFLSGVLCGLY